MEVVLYIIVGAIGFGILRGLFRSKLADIRNIKQRHGQAMAAAVDTLAGGNYLRPSWGTDPGRIDVVDRNIRTEIAKTFDSPDEILKGGHLLRAALTAAHRMERQGFGFFEQVTGAADFIALVGERGMFRKLQIGLEDSETENVAEAASQNDSLVIIAGLRISTDSTGLDLETVVSRQLSPEIVKRCPTELDLYRYLVEEAEWLSEDENDDISLDFSEIREVEYEGERAKASKYHRNRDALTWLDNRVMPDLRLHFGQAMADRIRGAVLFDMCLEHLEAILAVRLKYAVHYHNNCLKSGSYGYADRWAEVIDEIESRMGQL